MITLIIGSLGALILLIFFILNQIGKVDKESFSYDLANFTGGLLMVIYAAMIESWPFLFLNAIWMLFSLRDVINHNKKHGE